jgi:hypothetical protein
MIFVHAHFQKCTHTHHYLPRPSVSVDDVARATFWQENASHHLVDRITGEVLINPQLTSSSVNSILVLWI